MQTQGKNREFHFNRSVASLLVLPQMLTLFVNGPLDIPIVPVLYSCSCTESTQIGLQKSVINIGVTFLGKWSFMSMSPRRLRQKCGFHTMVFGQKNHGFSENCGFHVVSLKAQTEMWFLIKNHGFQLKTAVLPKTMVFAENAVFDGFCNHEV